MAGDLAINAICFSERPEQPSLCHTTIALTSGDATLKMGAAFTLLQEGAAAGTAEQTGASTFLSTCWATGAPTARPDRDAAAILTEGL